MFFFFIFNFFIFLIFYFCFFLNLFFFYLLFLSFLSSTSSWGKGRRQMISETKAIKHAIGLENIMETQKVVDRGG